MKKLIYTIALFSVLVLFNSCDWNKNNKPIEFSVQSVSQSGTDVTVFSDFCNSKEAVIINRSNYNSDTGETKFRVAYPSGHNLTTIANTRNNTVTFITRGKQLSNSVTYKDVYINGFKIGSGNSIKAFLEVHYKDGNNRCPGRLEPKGVKHGNSTIPGDPPLGQ
jgi:hypothetical protein